MFEAAELGSKIAKAEYKAQVPALRQSLLESQQELRSTGGLQVIVVLAGLEAAGRSETANLLNSWMDPRWIETRAWAHPSDEERERPPFWRYWRYLPQRGRVGLFLDAWYGPAFADFVRRDNSAEAFENRLDRIARFERAIAEDGAVIIKFFLHLAERSQKKRLKALHKDPLTRWRVTEEQWQALKRYDRIKAAAEHGIRRTNTPGAPWHVVEGADERYRNLTVATLLNEAIRNGVERARTRAATVPVPKGDGSVKPGDNSRSTLSRVAQHYNVLQALDLTQQIAKGRYGVELERQQGRLNLRQRQAVQQGLSTVAVFEGWDAAGKGGAIRRVAGALDAHEYQVIPIGAPTDEELSQHYLWRFWRRLSRAGRVTIFDRSWYGRVLVERVEGFASPAEVQRAYGEINDFEQQLVDHRILVTKFWLHISKDEQLRRFQDRQRQPHKRWKITEEDWRNRERWGDYEVAVNDMVERTSTHSAPWLLIEANDKNYARIEVIRALADRMERALTRLTAARSNADRK